jgi:hypothetical protein
LGHAVWHVPGELKRDSSSMLLGASLLRGSHCGSNCTGENGGGCGRHALPHDDDGMPLIMPFIRGILFGMHLVNSKETQVVCGGAHPCCEGRTVVAILNGDNGSVGGSNHNQRSLRSQHLLCVPRPRSPPFILKSKEFGGCIDAGHNSAAGPYSCGDNDGTAPCSPHNHRIGNDSMTYVEWDPECKSAIPSLLPPFCNLWTMFNNYILLLCSASDNLNSLLHAYECDHGFMSFNIFEELQEVDGKSPPSIGECYEYNHSKTKDFILWYSIIANTDKAQCTIGVKLHEHYHNSPSIGCISCLEFKTRTSSGSPSFDWGPT